MAKGVISISSSGSTKNTRAFFKRAKQLEFTKYLQYYGELGVAALAMETPVDTAETASSWNYEIEEKDGCITLSWTNSATAGNVPIVVLIMYGHATNNGGYVQPYDFVSPIVREIFEDIADTIWKEVTRK